MIVDSHQHFWNLSRADYGWLTPAAGGLYRDFLPDDLAPLLQAGNIDATVLVQAAPSEAETRYLFQLAQCHSFVAAVVGWVDFEAADVEQRIAALRVDGSGKLRGLRPMIQDLPDPNWIRQSKLDAAFEAMIAHDLVFDALVRPVHLDALRARLQRHPGLQAVLDHAGKPDISHNGFAEWADGIARLAGDTAAYCKLSGLLTEAGTRNSFTDIAPYVEHIFRCFGAERVLWGSDWPVLTQAGDYAQWLALARDLVERFGEGQKDRVFGATATRLYNLESTQNAYGDTTRAESAC